MAENKFENTGDFRGAALFQGSTIHNAGQIAGTIRNGVSAAPDRRPIAARPPLRDRTFA
jgi:hypothetical protein